MHEDDDHARTGGRSHGRAGDRRSWWGWSAGALDRLLAQRAADVDVTWSRLDDREAVASEEVPERRARARTRRGRAVTRPRRRGPHRVVRRFRLRFLTAALAALLALR